MNRPAILAAIIFSVAAFAGSSPAALPAATGTATQPAIAPAVSAADAKIIATADGIGYVEVVSVTRKDNRAADGELIEIVELKYLDHAGSYDGNIVITVDRGGRRNGAAFRPSGPALPGSMEKGKKYWIVFSMVVASMGPMEVTGMWPEEKAPVAALKERMAAIIEATGERRK